MNREDKRILTEVLAVYCGGLLVLYGAGLLAGVGGVLAENQGAITAAWFLLVPVALLRWRGRNPASFGIHGSGLTKSLLVALATAAIVLPPYAGGYEVWSRWLYGRELDVPDYPVSHFPSQVRGRPVLDDAGRGLYVWVERERFHAVYRGDGRVSVKVVGCAGPGRRLILEEGVRLRYGSRIGGTGKGTVVTAFGNDAGIVCDAGPAERLSIEVLDPIRPPVLSGEGRVRQSEVPFGFERNSWWLLELLLLHLIVVAFPEEVFYRGYVQSRLAPLFRRRVRVFGVGIGGNVIAASALFAASHLVASPSVFRLAVFFPGLLFGYLREKTGSVVAPAVLHAMCNVFIEVLVRYHS